MKISAATEPARTVVLNGEQVLPGAQSRAMPLVRHMLWWLIGLAMVHGLVFALLIPPWQAPDETGHFEYIWTLARLGAIPSARDASPQFERALIQSLYQYRYGEYIGRPLPEVMPDRMDDLPITIFARRVRTLLIDRFSIAYVWPALFISLIPDHDLVTQLYLARISAVFINAAIIVVAFLTFQEIEQRDWRTNLVAAALIALIPQHTFINSTVGEGALAELIAVWVLYCWIRLFRRGPGFWEVAGISAGVGMGISTKATTFFLVPLSIGLAAWWLAEHAHWLRQQSGLRLLSCALAGIALTGAVLAFTPALNRALELWRGIASTTTLVWRDARGTSLGEGLLLTYHSFWANFGWMSLPVAEGWYTGIKVLTVAALAGWAFGRGRACPRRLVGVLWAFIITAVLAFVVGGLLTQEYYWIQGRYLFTITAPFIYLLVNGLVRWVRPQHWRPLGFGLVVAAAGFDLWCMIGYIIPYYYS